MAKILQADRPRLEPLVAELQTFVAEIAHEAAAGDTDARRWLVSAFPGHHRIFASMWSRQNERPGRKETDAGSTAFCQ